MQRTSRPSRPTGEAALSADREPIAALLRHSFDAVALTDRESRRTVEVSDSFCALTGYAREELIGRTSVEIGLSAEDSLRARVIEQIDRGKRAPLRADSAAQGGRGTACRVLADGACSAGSY